MPDSLPVTVYLGLGSNLGDRFRMLKSAVASLLHSGIRVTRISAIYASEYVGHLLTPQPEFLNCVAEAYTSLAPADLLACLKSIEQSAGRQAAPADAPRPIDLDILLYGDCTFQEDGLTVPHPRMWDRAFVLLPLAELRPDIRTPWGVPVGNRAEELLQEGQCVERVMAWPATTAMVNEVPQATSTQEVGRMDER